MNLCPATILTASHLKKTFGANEVLKDLSLTISANEKILLLGANGSGKSTLLRALAGVLSLTSGSIQRGKRARPLGYYGQALMLYADLSVRENLTLFHRLLASEDAVESNLTRWQLDSIADRRVRELSRGQQSRVALCRALIGDPDLLLVDEPSAALDDRATQLLTAHIKENGSENQPGWLIATHDIARLESIATRILVLHGGSIAYDTQVNGPKDAALACYREINR